MALSLSVTSALPHAAEENRHVISHLPCYRKARPRQMLGAGETVCTKKREA